MLHALCFSDDLAHFALDDVAASRASGEVWDTSSGPIMIAGAFQWVWKSLSRHNGLVDGLGPDAEVADKIVARRGAVGAFLLGLPDRDALVASLARANLAWGDVKSGAGVHDVADVRGAGRDP